MLRKILFLVSIAVIIGCSPLKESEYCKGVSDAFTCIEFEKKNKFNYRHWIDTGSEKGTGTYQINKEEVVLNFEYPEHYEGLKYRIKKIKLDTIRKFRRHNNFIKILCLDIDTKKPINSYGNVYYSDTFADIFISKGKIRSKNNDTLSLNLSNLNFPIELSFNFGEYINDKMVIEEYSQYQISVELTKNNGYNITSGQKIIKRSNLVDTNKVIIPIEEFDHRKYFVKTK